MLAGMKSVIISRTWLRKFPAWSTFQTQSEQDVLMTIQVIVIVVFIHVIVTTLINTDSRPLACYLNNSTTFYEYLRKNLSLSQEVVDGIIGATIKLSKV